MLDDLSNTCESITAMIYIYLRDYSICLSHLPDSKPMRAGAMLVLLATGE